MSADKKKQKKPPMMDKAEWDAVCQAFSIITEHFQNAALFLNWVSAEGETHFYHSLHGNTFALENHIHKWADKDFDESEDESGSGFVGDDDDDDDEDNESWKENKRK